MNKKIHFAFCLAILLIGFKIVDVNEGGKSLQQPEMVDARSYIKGKQMKKRNGIVKMDSPEKYGEIQRQLRTPIDAVSPQYSPNYLVEELRKARKNFDGTSARNELDFVSRGPGNVAGRTRAILIDPRDDSHSTWIAGSASGGIWKTTDAGKTWRNLSEDLTSLSTNTLAMSPSNPDVIYAGTGEHFVNDTDGNGMWKSEDGGESWTQIANPEQYESFKNVSRIVVDPDNTDILLVATSNGSWEEDEDDDFVIWKSTDGGQFFERKYTSEIGRIDDLDANPQNFNTLYAAVEEYGVIKSEDGGESWLEPASKFADIGRVEISVSAVDTSYIWASAVGGPSNSGTTVYVSKTAGSTWSIIQDELVDFDYLGGQGFYDNIITAHPYNVNEAYIGGVNLFKINISGQVEEVLDFSVNEINTDLFMEFVGGTDFENDGVIAKEDLKSVSIRFGSGTQKAHRFTAGGLGAGVSFGIYDYVDYVEVPFTVWDKENEVQLMVSFRDQQMDGKWNLLELLTSGDADDQSREYLFIHDIPYDEEASPIIGVEGGIVEEMMYFIWPVLTPGFTFDPDNLPVSSLEINKVFTGIETSSSVVISDAYGQFNGNNTFSNDNFVNQKGMHPDQHNIVMIKENEADKTFRFIVTNDGGVYISNESSDPGTKDEDFNYGGFGYNTSQFYSADKAPGEHRYIGGMQDNSTFFTPAGVQADSAARYNFAIGGDGFESIWNNSNPFQLIGGSQFNNFARSLDGGKTWFRATDVISGTSPFISRLANSKRFPNRLFTLTSTGVWRSEDFGGSWIGSPLEEMWSFNNLADIEVSHADSSVVWAGGFLNKEERVFVSQDAGLTFSPVNNYEGEPLGFVSGIGTHPIDNATGYLLFSFSGKPKVIKTTDFGQTWEDISGYEGNNGISDRGFPNVAIQTLLVFPNNTNRIWVGSEIGIIESMDGGESWNLLDCNMPPVNVHDFKIQDDQIVIATYGRGIWSVQVDGIEQNYLLHPSVIAGRQDIKGDLDIDFYLPSKFDSSFVVIDGERYERVGANEVGLFTSLKDNLQLEGEIEILIESFSNGERLESIPFIIDLYIPGPIVTQYNNDFADDARINEFVGDGFRIILEEEFEDEAIHSGHPHANGIEYTYQLTSSYQLTDESPNQMRFNEVAIIEPGEPETVFGDSEFWDYVVVEGSKDGQTWNILAPGYDSRAHVDWLEAYNREERGTSELYKERLINLEETFDVGDTILVRFRLNADAFVNGWGWAIDDLEIGTLTSSVSDDVLENELSIFPNPVYDNLFIRSELDLRNAEVIIYNVSGEQVLNLSYAEELNVSQLVPGAYFMTIIGESVHEVHKFLKI
ncbi:T9SS type A sorting domain-containing protein [Portibacter lacus]|uniref:Secretion system C-terminal sorting domain-containing protein n=1 Tax=Portibacter lacus TaxID=1099794 RepID=A0AA37SMW4_9BACT|nr:T9SS type A sorting domain-containing protein [Portibacter lacus]GLR15954.1 hypothetical protein GCM10007940_05690 [Portibacter lacus]